MSAVNGPKTTRSYGGWSENIFANSIVIDSPFQLVMLSGVGAEDEIDGQIQHVGDISAQADMCYAKLKSTLASVGGTLADVVKITAYVTDADFREAYTQSRFRAFGEIPLPTHTFVVVSRLAWPDMLVEVDATAVLAR